MQNKATKTASATKAASTKTGKAKAVPQVGASKGKAKAKATPAPVKLTPNQVRFLQAIAASKTPITYGGLRKACNVKKGLSKAIGTPSKAGNAPHTLLALGYVALANKTVPFTFVATAAGKAALK